MSEQDDGKTSGDQEHSRGKQGTSVCEAKEGTEITLGAGTMAYGQAKKTRAEQDYANDEGVIFADEHEEDS